MSRIPKALMEIALLSVLVFGATACSDNDSLTDTPLHNDELGEYKPGALLRDQKEPQQIADGSEAAEEVASTVHKTILFSGASSELDEAAKETLVQAKDMLDDDMPTQVTVLAVGSGQAPGEDPSRITVQRAEAVTNFLSERGVVVSDMQIKLQGLPGDPQEQAELGEQSTLGPGGSVADATSPGEQEVVVTVVSTSRPI